MAEGAPLLRVYRGNSIEGSNPSLSAIFEPKIILFRKVGLTQGVIARIILASKSAPVAQLDRVPGYEPGGHTFESCRAHHFLVTNTVGYERFSSRLFF